MNKYKKLTFQAFFNLLNNGLFLTFYIVNKIMEMRVLYL